ncbi:MAG: hypothetical protein IJJ33_14750 [Victivallales bacterium]|nr:hypothetical protein [Victivallales bacterium]
MLRNLSVVLLTLFLALTLHAQTTAETVETEGVGITHNQAIANALAEAIRQVTGTALDNTRAVESALARVSTTTNGENTSTTTVSEQTNERLSMLTQGAVKTYRILSSEKQQDGSWKVRLTAEITRYQAPGLSPDTRRKIAMVPFTAREKSFTVGASQVLASTVTDDLLSDFNLHFTQSRRFAVLTRMDNGALSAEKRLIESNSPASEMAKLGQTLGLDYLVVGNVKQLYVAPVQTATIAISGAAVSGIDRAFIDLDYRIVVVATSQIKWADHLTIELTPQELAQTNGDVLTAYHFLMQNAGLGIAAAMDNIYPINGVKILSNGELVLDRGGSLIMPGALYDVYRLGEEITNPVNGESLGPTEERIATVQITRVDSKLSYAGLLKGYGQISVEDVQRGIILRPSQIPLPAEQPSAPPASRPVIKLPFDK